MKSSASLGNAIKFYNWILPKKLFNIVGSDLFLHAVMWYFESLADEIMLHVASQNF